MTPAQEIGLLAFAKYGHRVMGTRRLRITTFIVLHMAGLVKPEGENTDYWTGAWMLTEAGIAKVAELINVS